MTTEHVTKLLVGLLCAGAIATACIGGGAGRRGGLPESQVAEFPPDVAASYKLFAIRCSRCHTLSRPLNASIVEYNHWESYVARMRRHAGSGISPKDADKILVFLKYYANRRATGSGGAPADAPPPPAAPPPSDDGPPDGSSGWQMPPGREVVR